MEEGSLPLPSTSQNSHTTHDPIVSQWKNEVWHQVSTAAVANLPYPGGGASGNDPLAPPRTKLSNVVGSITPNAPAAAVAGTFETDSKKWDLPLTPTTLPSLEAGRKPNIMTSLYQSTGHRLSFKRGTLERAAYKTCVVGVWSGRRAP